MEVVESSGFPEKSLEFGNQEEEETKEEKGHDGRNSPEKEEEFSHIWRVIKAIEKCQRLAEDQEAQKLNRNLEMFGMDPIMIFSHPSMLFSKGFRSKWDKEPDQNDDEEGWDINQKHRSILPRNKAKEPQRKFNLDEKETIWFQKHQKPDEKESGKSIPSNFHEKKKERAQFHQEGYEALTNEGFTFSRATAFQPPFWSQRNPFSPNMLHERTAPHENQMNSPCFSPPFASHPFEATWGSLPFSIEGNQNQIKSFDEPSKEETKEPVIPQKSTQTQTPGTRKVNRGFHGFSSGGSSKGGAGREVRFYRDIVEKAERFQGWNYWKQTELKKNLPDALSFSSSRTVYLTGIGIWSIAKRTPDLIKWSDAGNDLPFIEEPVCSEKNNSVARFLLIFRGTKDFPLKKRILVQKITLQEEGPQQEVLLKREVKIRASRIYTAVLEADNPPSNKEEELSEDEDTFEMSSELGSCFESEDFGFWEPVSQEKRQILSSPKTNRASFDKNEKDFGRMALEGNNCLETVQEEREEEMGKRTYTATKNEGYSARKKIFLNGAESVIKFRNVFQIETRTNLHEGQFPFFIFAS